MRKPLVCLLLACIIAYAAWAGAWGVALDSLIPAAVATCAIGDDSTAGEYSALLTAGNDADRYYVGQYNWQNASARCICKVSLTLTKQGSITGKTYVARIWSQSGSNLGTQQGASTGVTGSDAWSSTLVDFEFASCINLSASTNYAITLDNSATDGTNYVSITAVANTITGTSGWWGSDKAIVNDSGSDLSMKIWW